MKVTWRHLVLSDRYIWLFIDSDIYLSGQIFFLIQVMRRTPTSEEPSDRNKTMNFL